MSFISNLVCRECARQYPAEALHVCDYCFGPLEVAYDYDAIAAQTTRETIAAGPLSIWRYANLLPATNDGAVDLGAGKAARRDDDARHVHAAAEHRHVMQFHARRVRGRGADVQDRAVGRIGEGAVPGLRHERPVGTAHLGQSQRRRMCGGREGQERNRDGREPKDHEAPILLMRPAGRSDPHRRPASTPGPMTSLSKRGATTRPG